MLKPNAPGWRGQLHARLERVERNLYRAVFPGESNPDRAPEGQTWPDSHLGDSPEAVKTFVENLAREMGYSEVIWER